MRATRWAGSPPRETRYRTKSVFRASIAALCAAPSLQGGDHARGRAPKATAGATTAPVSVKSMRCDLKKCHTVARQFQVTALMAAFGQTVSDDGTKHDDIGQRQL